MRQAITLILHTAILLSVIFVPAAAYARPMINPGGVTNLASMAPAGLPNTSGIAQGSIFVVQGTGLGDDNPNAPNLFQNTTYPLPSSAGLNGTTITFNVGRNINAIMLYESATMLVAILPSNTPTGQAAVKVTYNGQSSTEAVTVQVVRQAFGMFTRSNLGATPLGVGPVVAQNVGESGSVVTNTLTHSAKPGQTVVLYGTGLGPVGGDESQGPIAGVVGLAAFDFQIWVGNKPAILDPSADYVGRAVFNGGGSYAGVDLIEFQLPNNVQGCYVPVAVTISGVTSNIGTISIDPSGGLCSEAASRYSSDDLQQVINDQAARIGSIALMTLTVNAVSPNGQTASNRIDGISASFASLTSGQFYSAPASPSPGGCTVTLSGSGDAAFNGLLGSAVIGTAIDAGPAINANGPDGQQQAGQAADLTYSAMNNNSPFVDPGDYSVDNGGGGADVGAFQAAVTVPQVLQWVNANMSTIPRNQPLRIQWTGGDPNGLVSIIGLSADPNAKVGALFSCTEMAAAQQFTVPSYVLSWLPNNTLPVSFLIVSATGQSRFQAPGLEMGYLSYMAGTARNVQFVAAAGGGGKK